MAINLRKSDLDEVYEIINIVNTILIYKLTMLVKIIILS